MEPVSETFLVASMCDECIQLWFIKILWRTSEWLKAIMTCIYDRWLLIRVYFVKWKEISFPKERNL